jgi:hypothetical protein
METINNTNADGQTYSKTLSKKLTSLFIGLFVIHFILNFLGLGILQYFYLIELAVFMAMIFLLDPTEVLPYFFPLLMIEGQGRVLWSYNAAFRLLFDVFLLLIAFRIFYIKKRIIDVKAIPNYVYLLIFFHFVWYAIQLFNPNSVGPVGVLAASKAYIVPFIIFLSFLANDGLSRAENLVKTRNILLLTLGLESALAIYQFSMGDAFIISLHPYYAGIIGDGFSGLLYRSFGTTHLPGGYSIYIVLFLPLIFLSPPKKRIYFFLQLIVIALALYAMFLSQVRSAFIKTILIIVVISAGLFLRGEHKFKKLVKLIAGIFIGVILFNMTNFNVAGTDDKYKNALVRFYSIFDSRTLSQSREGPSVALTYILKKIEDAPLGLGPGRTGAASGMNKDKIKNDPIFGLAESWAWDNLVISLSIDFGIGMVFYLLIIILLPLKLFNHCVRAFLRNSPIFPALWVTSISSMIILVGNWGAIGLPYNPESFCFWFFIALGFKNVEESNFESLYESHEGNQRS